MYGSVTYFGLRDDRKVLSYNSVTNKWSHLPECPRVQFTLAVVNDLVTAVGGKKDGERTNTLLSFSFKEGAGLRNFHTCEPNVSTLLLCAVKTI